MEALFSGNLRISIHGCRITVPPPQQYQGSLDDLLTNKAIEQIVKHDQQPWFINLWLFSPHTPYQPSAEFAARFPATPEGKFLAVLAQLDNNIARILQALDQSGQADNTILVLASDNGGPSYARDKNWPLQGVKATYLEGGVRRPLLLRWPGNFSMRIFQLQRRVWRAIII